MQCLPVVIYDVLIYEIQIILIIVAILHYFIGSLASYKYIEFIYKS